MVSQIPTAEAFFERILANAPAGENPVSFIRAALSNKAHPHTPPSFLYQLYALSGVLGLVPLILIATLVVRWWNKSLWLFRLQEGFLVPHYTTSWSIFTAIAAGLMQGFCWKTIYSSSDDPGTHVDLVLWKTLTWIPSFLSFWFANWSLMVSHILHRRAGGRLAKGGFWTSATFMNSYGIGVPVIFILVVGTLSFLSSMKYREALVSFASVDQALAVAEAAYTATSSLDELLVDAELAAGVFFVQFSTSIDYFKWTFAAYFVFNTILQITLISVAIVHLISLRQMLAKVKDAPPSSHLANSLAYNTPELVVRRTYRALVAITLFFVAITTLFGALDLFVCVASVAIATQGSAHQAASLVALYLSAVLGLPLSILLIRSFDVSLLHLLRSFDRPLGGHILQDSDDSTELKPWTPSHAQVELEYPAAAHWTMSQDGSSLGRGGTGSVDWQRERREQV